LSVLASSCTASLENAPCPCADGFECCVALDTCYPHGHVCGDPPGDDGGRNAGFGGETAGRGGAPPGLGGASAAASASATDGGAAGDAPSQAGESGMGGSSSELAFSLVATEHNDLSRTGANLQETVLTSANVNPRDFGELARRPLRGAVFAQPLLAPGVAIAPGVMRDVLYVCTMANVVYALDARDVQAPPLWFRTLDDPIELPDPLIEMGARQIWHEVGIFSTPVLSVEEGALYVVSAGKQADAYRHRLYKLSASNGSVLGSVEVADAAGLFSSARQAQRSALTLSNGVIYVPFGAYDASSDASGWLFVYDTDLVLLGSRMLGTSSGVGVMMGGHGPAADGASVFFTTEPNNRSTGADEPLGGRLLELHDANTADLSPRFWPTAAASGTNELGSSGPLLIPGTNRAVLAGQHALYVVPRTGSSGDSGESSVQMFRASASDLCSVNQLTCSTETTSPVFWPGSGSAPVPRLYVWPTEDVLRAFPFDLASGRVEGCANDLIRTCPSSKASRPGGDSGDFLGDALETPVSLSVSSNGTRGGSGIVWAAHAYETGGGGNPDGIVRAFDAESLSLSWSTENSGVPLGPLAPGVAPTVSGGRVFIGTSDGITAKKTFEHEVIADTPAITSFNDQALVVAWGLTSATNRGFRIAWSSDGSNFETSGISGNYPMYEPALTASPTRVYLGWTDISEMVNVVMSDQPSFADPQLMTARTETGEIRPFAYHATTAPALAYGNGHLVMASNERSNIRVLSSADGKSFDLTTSVLLRGYSDHPPALSYANGKLYLISTNNYNQINLFVSKDDGASFDAPTLLSVTSSGHPALLSNPPGTDLPEFYLAWSDVNEIGARGGQIKVASLNSNDFSLLSRTHELSPELAQYSLSAARFKGAWYLAWMGSNGARQPNVARYTSGEIVSYGLKGR